VVPAVAPGAAGSATSARDRPSPVTRDRAGRLRARAAVVPTRPARRRGGGFRGGSGGGAGRFDAGIDRGAAVDSLPADNAASEAAAAEEAALTPEQLLAKKLEEMKRKLMRSD
jgi:hypothetical protein